MAIVKMKSAIRLLVLAAMLAPPCSWADGPGRSEMGDYRGGRRSVPELDPAAIGAVAAVLGAGGVLIARRKR